MEIRNKLGSRWKSSFYKVCKFHQKNPIDFIIPAEEYNDTNEEEVNQEDADNDERLDDDKFDNVEMIVKKDRELEELRKAAIKQEQVIKELELKISEKRKPTKDSSNINLPNLYQTIDFTESKTGNKL